MQPRKQPVSKQSVSKRFMSKQPVIFSLPSGIYRESEIAVELFAKKGCSIYYTTDGTLPTLSSTRYESPLVLADRTPKASVLLCRENNKTINVAHHHIYDDPSLPKAHIIRAIAVTPEGEMGAVSNATYFVGDSLDEAYLNMPIVSVVCSPANLIDYETGILVRGRIYDEWLKSNNAQSILADDNLHWRIRGNHTQKGRAWERPASFELIFNRASVAKFMCGMRLKGGGSRMFAHRSFNFYLRSAYGQKAVEYPLIPSACTIDGKAISSYSRFALRNGGNDTEYLKFKDAFLQSLVADCAFDTQAQTPVIAFLNGEYYGIYNLIENYAADYYAQHYGVSKKNVVAVKEGKIKAGTDDDSALYEHLLNYANHNLSDADTWCQFSEDVDIKSMIDYFAAEIYIGNADFSPTRNFLIWRVRTPLEGSPFADGRWRFSLYDTEFSSNLYDLDNVRANWNSFDDAVTKHPLFAAALQNAEFRTRFLARLQQMGQTNFDPNHVNESLERFAATWAPYMPDYYKRFGDTSWAWEMSLSNIRRFFAHRYQYIVSYVQKSLAAYE